MIYSGHNSSYAAVSFETTMFSDLASMMQDHGLDVMRLDPMEFLERQAPEPDVSMINLVTMDKNLRRQITQHLDQLQQPRFSFYHKNNSYIGGELGPGNFLYPFVGVGTKTVVGKDTIIQAFNAIGHNVRIGDGTIIDCHCTISGSSVIGEFCHIHTRSMIYDKVSVCDDVEISNHAVIKKNITEAGTYATVTRSVTKKLS